MLRRYKIDHKAMCLEKKFNISDYNITLTLSHNLRKQLIIFGLEEYW